VTLRSRSNAWVATGDERTIAERISDVRSSLASARSRAAISPSARASAPKSWRLARHWRASPKVTIVAKPAIGTMTGISAKSV
jgi:hypothetical protein